jgi:cyclopropane fatty-acyl-phospholipid synthase-like methyltransferase
VILSQHEAGTPLWQKLKEHYEAELASARRRLEAMIDEKETIMLRAKIEVFKNFLAMGEPSKK